MSLFTFFLPGYSEAEERAVLRVFLNTVDRGDHFVTLTEDGDVLFPYKELEAMGIKDLPEAEGERISLKSLSPGVSFDIDIKEAALRMTADPRLFPEQEIDLTYERRVKAFHVEYNSGFLNYGINYNMDDDFDFSSLSVPLEAGLSIEGALGFSSFIYRKSEAAEEFLRLLSNITVDDRARRRRHLFGDVSATSGELGSAHLLGGVSVFKNFSLAPRFVLHPGLNYAGVLHTPSEVKVYINELLVKTLRLPPGPFELRNVPNALGGGEVKVVIQDAFGNEEEVTKPFYVSSRLLKPGLHDYGYSLGFKREEFGQESFSYGGPAFFGSHRMGLSRNFTLGWRGEADDDAVNIGMSGTALLWGYGEARVALALSKEGGAAGYAGTLDYFYAGKGISGRFAVKGFSRGYSNVSLAASDDKPRFQGLVGLGFSRKSLGSISASYSVTDLFTGEDLQKVAISYHRVLFKDASLNLRSSITKVDGEDTITDFFVTLHYSFGKRTSGSLDYNHGDGGDSQRVSIQQSPRRGEGLAYRVFAERRELAADDTQTGGGAFVQYQGRYGIYSADYRRVAQRESSILRLAGGLAFINRSIYPSRPVTDGFALVKVGDLGGVRVNQSNQEVGVTNKKGEVLVPGLISYYENDISIEDEDVPLNYELADTRRHVSVPVRGGGVLEFDVTKLQAFVGTLFFVERGEKTEAQYAGLDIQLDGRKMDVLVGMGGKFYIENLPAGTYPARLYSKDKECLFEMTVPESEEILVDLGEVTCEID